MKVVWTFLYKMKLVLNVSVIAKFIQSRIS